jgi:uncharacterized membrane protein YvlD (DUF360 family)
VSRRGLAIVVFVQLAALVAVCLLIGDNGWDDGAITVAFARTFARHGVVALTPRSETVEGFSSVSWFLLNVLPALARPSYGGAIFFSQLLSALSICASTALLGRTCSLLRLDRLWATLTVVAFAAWGCSFYEAANGMEMGLLAAAVLVIVNELLSPEPRPLLLTAGVVLAVSTRFEAVVYVAVLALAAASVRGRRAFSVIVGACLGTVLLLSIGRFAVFSDVLPNTFWAKRWPPYAAFGVTSRLTAALELPFFFLVPLGALAILRRAPRDLGGMARERRRALVILGCPTLGAILVGGLLGKHWGYWGRMPYFAFPLALALVALLLSSAVSARGNRPRVAVAVGAFVSAIGVSMTGFPSGPLADAFHGGSFGVTPHTYAASGQVFRRFAAAAALQHPTVLTPDVGGLALCCDELRIVDLALLSNRKLAHRGHAALAEVLETESPEIVEAHWHWASLGGLYDLPAFRERYLPAFAGGTKLWIRRDVATTIESKGRGCQVAVEHDDVQAALRAHRYANHDLPVDRSSFERAGTILVLNEADPVTGDLCR